MQTIPHHSSRRSGFSLIAATILVTAAAIVVVSVLPGQRPGDGSLKGRATVERLERIEKATTSFMALNGRRPCPADGSLDVNNANFGKEVGAAGTCTPTTGMLGPDATGHIVGGIVPTEALGLDNSYAFDEFGRRIMYLVDIRATGVASCPTLQNASTNNGKGGIIVENTTSGTVLDDVMAVYISYGADGFGAFPPQGSLATARINNGSTDADELTNAGVNSSFAANFTNVVVQKAKTSTFDDIVYYAQYQKNICTVLGTGGSSSTCSLSANQNGGSAGTMAVGAPTLTEFAANTGSPCTSYQMSCNAGTPPTLSCSGGGGMGNCQYSICNSTCGLSGNQGGGSLNSGSSLPHAYQNLSDAGCTSHVLSCTNGTLYCDGSTTLTNCTYNTCTQSCPLNANQNGGSVGTLQSNTPGNTKTEYTAASDGTCTAHTATCTGTASTNTLSCSTGLMSDCQYSSCGIDCGLTGNQGGGVLLSGNTTPEYTSNSASSCTSHTMTCTNGTLSCSTGLMSDCTYNTCSLTCSLTAAQGGGTLNGASPGNTATEYTALTAPSCPAHTLTCTNGVTSCSTGTSGDCTYNSCSVSSSSALSGFRIDGPAAATKVGNGVLVADINGDGIPDIIIGSGPSANNSLANSGSVYVVFGTTAGFPDPLPLSTLNGTNGFRLDGESASNFTGYYLAAGDFNGDGIADLIISATGGAYNGASSGSVYVVFGGPTMKNGTAWTTCPCQLTSGGSVINITNGFRLDGGSAGEITGKSVATGDFNGDGIADIVIGANQSGYNSLATSGSVYVVYGSNVTGKMKDGATAWAANQKLTSGSHPIDGTNGFRLDGATATDVTGWWVATGDVNGDGVSDIVFGAPNATYGGAASGSVYVVYGSNVAGKMKDGVTAWAANQKLTSGSHPIDNTNGFRLNGVASDHIGDSVATGDVNGDGYADIIIGAYQAGYNSLASSGSVYVVYGGTTMKNGTAWSTCPCALTSGGSVINATNGFRLDGASASDFFGYSLNTTDLNRDGYADIIIGAYKASYSASNSGSAYLVYGGASGKMKDGVTAWAAHQQVTSGVAPIDGTNGFRLDGQTASDAAGYGVNGGDVNGDGYPDLIIGAWAAGYNSLATSGSVYVVNGQSCSLPATINGLGTVVTAPAVCSPNTTVPSTYMAVTSSSAPLLNIYKINPGDTFTKLPNPATMPAGSPSGVAFSSDHRYLAVAHATSPFVTIYHITTGDTFTKIANPASLPVGTTGRVAFSPDTKYMALTTSVSPYITIYKITSGDTFTKLANPATLPAGWGYDVAFSADNKYMAVAHLVSPYVTIYSINEGTDTFTKLANPATLPSNGGYSVAFSSDNNYLTVGQQNSPFVNNYSINEGTNTFTALATPATLPPATVAVGGSAFSPDVKYLAGIWGGISPYEIIYKITGGPTFTALSNPATLPTGTVTDNAFSHDNTYLAVTEVASPYVIIYKINESTDSFTKISNPATLPAGAGLGVAFSPY